jgi:hypothetical protein
MFISLLKLIRFGYPSKSGIRLARVISRYLILGIKNFPKVNKQVFPKLQIGSKLWQQYNRWLIFQIKYIDPRDWGNTPLIRDVTLTKTDPLQRKVLETISVENVNFIRNLATGYGNAFRGLEIEEIVNWLNHNFLMLNAFEEQHISPLAGVESLSEIGPGFGPVMALASRKKRSFYSFDTFEMQIIARHVCENTFKGSSNIVYQPTNLVDEGSLKFIPEEKFAIIAFYSFTEINLAERVKFLPLFKKSEYSLIATNEKFEGVDNFEYIEELAEKIGAECQYKRFEDIFGTVIPNYKKWHRLYLIRKKG